MSYNKYSPLDPDAFVSNMAAQLARTEKMQEEYNRKLEERQMKMREREERRREEILRNMTGSGHRLGGESSSSKGSKSFKPGECCFLIFKSLFLHYIREGILVNSRFVYHECSILLVIYR